jgi:8-oxo-dGTP pyrophosphatase MutT (NUDIX family)
LSTKLDADSVAALIFTRDGRYLLQKREDIAGISFPGMWGLFGGSCDDGESPQTAMLRELKEELAFRPAAMREVLIATFDDRHDRAMRSRRRFYETEIDQSAVERFTLGEGTEMRLFTVAEIGGLGLRAIPFDVCAIFLHARHHEALLLAAR